MQINSNYSMNGVSYETRHMQDKMCKGNRIDSE